MVENGTVPGWVRPQPANSLASGTISPRRRKVETAGLPNKKNSANSDLVAPWPIARWSRRVTSVGASGRATL